VASARSIPALGATSLLVLAAVVSGCATTQDADKRIEVRFDRTLTSRKPLELRGTARDVQVVRTAVVDGKDSSAIVVVLRNNGDKPVNDLPIEVGPRGGDAINAAANVPYFQSHAPAIAPGEESTWVYVSKEPLGTDEAFARVGEAAQPPLTTADGVSDLTVDDASAKGASSAEAEVKNDTGVPQYDLDVYAVALRDGRYVAAGRAALTHLGVSQTARVSLPLVGDAKGSEVQIFAPQTLFE
jgi:hypothetical protein